MHIKNGFLLTVFAVAVGVAANAAPPSDVALHYSTYQEERFRYMPGEYDGQFKVAGGTIKETGFDWDRVDSKAIEQGALVRQGFKVLVISYISVLSGAEAKAITDFVENGGKLFLVYASCDTEYKDGKFGQPGKCLIGDALGMDSAGAEGGCHNMRVDSSDHPVVSMLPLAVVNQHGYSVRMRPRAGTKVVASWVANDLTTPIFEEKDNGAILVSPSAVYVSLFLWRLPEAKIIVDNALSFLLGRPQKVMQRTWERHEQSPHVDGGLNVPHQKSDKEDVDAIGWPIAERKNGLLRPTCAVVYPADTAESYYAAKRLARALSCPLVPDQAVARDHLFAEYNLIAVGCISKKYCENLLGNVQRGVGALISENAGTTGKAIVRLAPQEASARSKQVLLVGGTDAAGLDRAEGLVRAGVEFAPDKDEGKALVWQPGSAFGDLVYPWTPVGNPISRISIPTAVNQRAKAQLVVTASMGYQPLELDLRLSSLSGPGGAIPQSKIQLLATRYVKSNITRIPEPDPLEPISHVSIEPGGHQQLWLIVDTTDLKPGAYQGGLLMVNEAGREVASIAVTVEVSPVTLSPRNRHDLLCTVWDYQVSGSMHGTLADSFFTGDRARSDQRTFLRWGDHYQRHFRENWQAYVRDLEEHGINVMFLSPEASLPQYQMGRQPLDERVAGQLVRYGKQHGFRLFIFTQVLAQSSSPWKNTDEITRDGSPMFSPKWDEAYRDLLRAYVRFAQRVGLDFKQWAVYPYDEPHTEEARKVVNHTAKLMREVDPRIQLWSDPARPETQELGDMVDYWKSMEKSIDIWWPGDGYIAKGSAGLAYLKGLGKPFGFYRCSAYSTKDRNAVQPDRYYRMFGWEAMDREASGMGFWTWCAWLGDSWNDEDISIRTGDGAVVYEGPAGPVTSISWEAWSEGLDDYKYLAALKSAIAEREKVAGKGDVRSVEARKLLSEAVTAVVKDPRQADRQRARVRERILELAALH